MKNSKRNTPGCARCENNIHVIPIAYGYPGPEMSREASKGNIRLGGCCVTLSERAADAFSKAEASVEPGEPFDLILEFADPNRYCKKHDLEF